MPSVERSDRANGRDGHSRVARSDARHEVYKQTESIFAKHDLSMLDALLSDARQVRRVLFTARSRRPP